MQSDRYLARQSESSHPNLSNVQVRREVSERIEHYASDEAAVDVLAVFDNVKNAWSKYAYDSKSFIYRIRDAYDGISIQQVE